MRQRVLCGFPEVVDRLAAAVILQAWLDAQRPKTISSEEPI